MDIPKNENSLNRFPALACTVAFALTATFAGGVSTDEPPSETTRDPGRVFDFDGSAEVNDDCGFLDRPPFP